MTAFDPTKLNPQRLASLTDELNSALERIRDGQKQKGQDSQAAESGLEQIASLKRKIAEFSDAQFVAAIEQMAQRSFSNSLAKEFWEPATYEPVQKLNAGREDGTAIALLHGEVAELLESMRDIEMKESKKIPGFSQAEEEAADIFLRLADYAKGRALRLGLAILAKHAYNLGRPIKHGRAF